MTRLGCNAKKYSQQSRTNRKRDIQIMASFASFMWKPLLRPQRFGGFVRDKGLFSLQSASNPRKKTSSVLLLQTG